MYDLKKMVLINNKKKYIYIYIYIYLPNKPYIIPYIIYSYL